MKMKTFKKLLVAISLLTIFNVSYAQLSPNDIKQLAQNTQADSMHKYSADGKIKYEYQIKTGTDGKPELVTKKSYLPAVTDGKIIDKTKSFKLALNAKKFGKYLTKGAGYATFAQLAIDLLGSGVDYVLDPKNNTIQKINRQLRCQVGSPYNISADTPDDLADMLIIHPVFIRQNGKPDRSKFTYDKNLRVLRYGNFSYGGCSDLKKDVQVMSEEEFAKEILKAAQNNDKAKKVIVDYAKNEIKNGDHDSDIKKVVDELNNDTDTSTDNKTDTTTSTNQQQNQKENKDKKEEGGNFELPPFCNWAAKVCDFIDWIKEPPPPEEENKPIPKANLNDIDDLQELDRYKQRINFEGQCPTGQLSFTVKSVSYSYSIPYTHFCSLLEQLRPWLLAFAYLSTAYFVVSNL